MPGPAVTSATPQLACQLRVCLGHVDRGALVADINDADSLSIQPHPDRHDMPAAKREDMFDAALLEKPRDKGGGAVRRDFHHYDSDWLKQFIFR